MTAPVRTIWKFPLQVTDAQEIDLPHGSRVLSVLKQRDTLCLWAEVTPSSPIQTRKVFVRGTGNPLEFPGVQRVTFIGTVLDGGFVWHVYVEDER